MATLIQYKNNIPGVKIAVDKLPFRIGRSEDNDLCIDDALSSREHALLDKVTSENDSDSVNYVLRDLDSTNGTFVNHTQVKAHLLVDGDMIRIGQSFFKFSEHDQPNPGDTQILKKSIIPGVYYTTDKKK
jgi:pSer/pThr/pTyr-binding forkhead associated (FHA) protein